jgi:hypothetical protein
LCLRLCPQLRPRSRPPCPSPNRCAPRSPCPSAQRRSQRPRQRQRCLCP